MQNRKPTGPVADTVAEIATGLGYTVVEFSAERVKGRTHVHCVLYHPDGVQLDALGEVHTALQPRLESLLEDNDLHIEFSSPGVERTFKSFHEFEVFQGVTVRVLSRTTTQWITGTIREADDSHCVIVDDSGETHSFSQDDVAKARLTD